MNITQNEIKKIVSESINECLVKDKSKLTLTIDECSKLTGIGRNKLTELICSDNTDFPYFKVGSKYLINKDMLVIWLEKVTKEGRTL